MTERTDLEVMTKVAVRALADKLLDGTAASVAACVRFVCADTRGPWHGRGRAMMCRRLKHVEVTRDQRLQLVATISRRQQFRDELRLVVVLDRDAAFATASAAIQSDAEHVRRLGNCFSLRFGERDPHSHEVFLVEVLRSTASPEDAQNFGVVMFSNLLAAGTQPTLARCVVTPPKQISVLPSQKRRGPLRRRRPC